MKQQRKNRTNQSVIWPPTPYFTIAELYNLNSKFVKITLRTRLTTAIESGKVSEIGSVPGGKGRPPKVFALTPVSKLTFDKAKQDDINLVDNYEKLINVVSVVAPVTESHIISDLSGLVKFNVTPNGEPSVSPVLGARKPLSL
jgi:hypothetical protein